MLYYEENIPFDKQSEKPSDEPSDEQSDKLTDQQSLDIQIVQSMLEGLNVSQKTMEMFEILKKYKHGKIKLHELHFGASRGMFNNSKSFVERTIKRFYDEELTAEEKTNLNKKPKLDQTNLALNEEPKLNQTNLEVLENTLKRYFNKSRVLDKGCLLTLDCCTHVGEKINNLVEELKTFLTNLKYDLQTTTLAGIAPSLDGRYTVAKKDTSIFKYFIQKCFATDNKITLEQLESFKPQIQFLENFFGFENTFFPTKYNQTPVNVMAAGRTHSRRKRHASKKSCKSHRRHRRSTHNKKRNTKRHMKRHTKRYRHRK